MSLYFKFIGHCCENPTYIILSRLFVDKGCYEIVKKSRQTTSSVFIFELSTKFTTKEINKNSSMENNDTVKPLT